MNYLVVTCSEDGDVRMERLSKNVIEERLAESYYGASCPIQREPPKHGDLASTPGVWICGDLVTATPVEVTTKWRVG